MIDEERREEHEERDPSTGVEVVAGAVSTGIGALLGGVGGDIAGASLQPLVAQALHRAGAEIGLWRKASATKVLNEAAQLLKRPADQMVQDAARSSESAQLLADTIFAAARTFNENKIRALARALANGLRDDQARPDEEQLVVAALADVEAPHIKVLTRLGPERGLRRTAATNLRSRSAPATRGLRPTYLAETCQLSVPAVRAVLSVLERAGMAVIDDGSETARVDKLIIEMQEEVNKIRDLLISPPKSGRISSSKKPSQLKPPGLPAASGWFITPFGQVCLDYLQEVDTNVVASEALDEPVSE